MLLRVAVLVLKDEYKVKIYKWRKVKKKYGGRRLVRAKKGEKER
jgi:hypothetical protein